MRTVLYSLKTINDRSVLSIDLSNGITDENNQQLTVRINDRYYNVQKGIYLNNFKIYDTNDCFFIVATAKKIAKKWAYKCLIEYAISKANKRIENIQSFKERLQNELQVA